MQNNFMQNLNRRNFLTGSAAAAVVLGTKAVAQVVDKVPKAEEEKNNNLTKEQIAKYIEDENPEIFIHIDKVLEKDSGLEDFAYIADCFADTFKTTEGQNPMHKDFILRYFIDQRDLFQFSMFGLLFRSYILQIS
jgi:secreted PhoX family phosphatase